MKLNQIRYFLHIVDAGSMSKAAKLLGVAQPALSQHVANLEHQLSAKLLIRTPSGVQCTPAGEVFCHHAKTILRQVDQARLDVKHLDQTPRGEVVLALAAAVANEIAAPLAQIVESKYPDIRLTTIEAMTVRTSNLIENGQADLGLAPNAHLLSGVEAIPVIDENLYFGGHSGMKLAGTSPIKFKEACAEQLILPTRPHFTRNSLEQLAFDHGITLNVRADQDSALLMLSYLNQGYAYSILPWPCFYEGVQSGHLFARKVIAPEIKRTLTIGWSKHRPLTRAAVVVRQYLLDAMLNLQKKGVLDGKRHPMPPWYVGSNAMDANQAGHEQ